MRVVVQLLRHALHVPPRRIPVKRSIQAVVFLTAIFPEVKRRWSLWEIGRELDPQQARNERPVDSPPQEHVAPTKVIRFHLHDDVLLGEGPT